MNPRTDEAGVPLDTAYPARVTDDATDSNVARRVDPQAVIRIRDTDMEPYVGLRYLSKLFKLMALVLVMLLFAEVVTGISVQGGMSIPTLLAEASRLIVLAGLLWGAGDLAILMIDVGHDVRATRILVGRQAAHLLVEHRGERATHRPSPPLADAPPERSDVR